MGTRLKLLRTQLGMTQEEFAKKIGVRRNTIAQYELGRNEPIKSIMALICREFNVSEEWLRTGNGEMFVTKTKNQEILSFLNEVAGMPDDAFTKRLAYALSKMDERGWDALEKFLDNLKL